MEDTLDNIKKVIAEDIRPILAGHSGDMQVTGYEDGILYFKLLGNCGSCPSAVFTVDEVIEQKLKEKIPGIQEIVLDTTLSDDMTQLIRDIFSKKRVFK